MCDMEVDLSRTSVDRIFAPERDCRDEMTQLRGLEEEGLCKLDGSRVRVPDEARFALRVVCSVFDAYLAPNAEPGTPPQCNLRDRCVNSRGNSYFLSKFT